MDPISFVTVTSLLFLPTLMTSDVGPPLQDSVEKYVHSPEFRDQIPPVLALNKRVLVYNDKDAEVTAIRDKTFGVCFLTLLRPRWYYPDSDGKIDVLKTSDVNSLPKNVIIGPFVKDLCKNDRAFWVDEKPDDITKVHPESKGQSHTGLEDDYLLDDYSEMVLREEPDIQKYLPNTEDVAPTPIRSPEEPVHPPPRLIPVPKPVRRPTPAAPLPKALSPSDTAPKYKVPPRLRVPYKVPQKSSIRKRKPRIEIVENSEPSGEVLKDVHPFKRGARSRRYIDDPEKASDMDDTYFMYKVGFQKIKIPRKEVLLRPPVPL